MDGVFKAAASTFLKTHEVPCRGSTKESDVEKQGSHRNFVTNQNSTNNIPRHKTKTYNNYRNDENRLKSLVGQSNVTKKNQNNRHLPPKKMWLANFRNKVASKNSLSMVEQQHNTKKITSPENATPAPPFLQVKYPCAERLKKVIHDEALRKNIDALIKKIKLQTTQANFSSNNMSNNLAELKPELMACYCESSKKPIFQTLKSREIVELLKEVDPYHFGPEMGSAALRNFFHRNQVYKNTSYV